MVASISLLVFSDLDGTLIDHDTYRWDAAKPALDRLQSLGVGIVLASSKTAAEVIALQDGLGLSQWPAIVENGASVLHPHTSNTRQQGQYKDLLAVLDHVPGRLRSLFRGFGDMNTATVAQVTGLSMQASDKAKDRWFSEPGLWGGTTDERDEFVRHLLHHGVHTSQGGRFLTLSFGQTKADAMAEIVTLQQPRYTVALGDAPNDIEMLQRADYGVIVFNPNLPALPTLKGEAEGRIVRTELAGPAGWNTAMLALIERLVKLSNDSN